MYPQVFGKYVLERELSRGGMARVLLATLRGAGGFEKRLVVKQIRDELAYDQQFVRRFVEEAKTTVALSHPNIVPVYELGIEAGTYFLAMELVEGLSIAEMLRERRDDGEKRVLTPEEGAYVGMEVCRALEYAHRRMKVVHRDITPRNVMIDEEGQVKLIDFGIAAPARVAGHEILGSPGHMPPEQVDGKELGPSTDIFAVAVLLMEAWTGTAPFRRATPEACDAAMREPHPRPSDFDPRLAPLDEPIGRAMQLDPRERQQKASELGRALRAFFAAKNDPSDLARALGDRVRDQRVAVSNPAPASTKATPREPQASQAELGTKTFAAREEALDWSSPNAPSTRRLEDAAGPTKDPAMSIPTPLMIEPTPLDTVETIATRPLETPSRPSAPPAKRKRIVTPVVAACLIALVGFAVWRARAPGPSHDSPVEQLAAPPPPSVAPPVATSAFVPERTPDTVPTIVPEPLASIAVVTPARAPAAHTSMPVSVGRATVTFLADPGTRATIDGVARGACPLKLPLEPGQHEVRFVFEPTGESRGERFSVKAGDRVTVRAEFTGATPTVRIQR